MDLRRVCAVLYMAIWRSEIEFYAGSIVLSNRPCLARAERDGERAGFRTEAWLSKHGFVHLSGRRGHGLQRNKGPSIGLACTFHGWEALVVSVCCKWSHEVEK